ncbi:NADPH-dependent FMN reductase [Actinomadura craniellae]|uniref:NADPH-dependent FMN reductase n=1 Tax=Actinomadura craniellae TaxID=2231787 RepID=A0A365GWU5_9ACTN|nr:NADPH-dependent FMN reductase [Actinomadura craniellae]RAY11301.1 NADPH-dependent FMN reductase [Actinomadura craniellae]
MTEDRMRIVIIIGGVQAGRSGHTVANWFASQACRHGELDVDIIDLAKTWLPDVLTDGGDSPPRPVQDLAPWLEAADAFVIVTPEHDRGFPASLKNAIGWYGEVWKAKPVGFVSYGGPAAGLRAVDALKPIFTELHAVSVQEAVFFRDLATQFDGDGHPVDPGTCNTVAKSMLDQLLWWALALREGRSKRPYGSWTSGSTIRTTHQKGTP